MTTIAVTEAIRSFAEVESRFGLVRSLDHFMFVKKQGSQYDLSDDFSLFKRSKNELYPVLQILKSFANI